MVRHVKKILEITYKTLLTIVLIVWLGLIYTEYRRFEKNESMLVVLKEENIKYDDGNVNVKYGLGYKEIIYNRESIQARAFGHIFLKVKESNPNNK